MSRSTKNYFLAGFAFLGMFLGLLGTFSWYQHSQITFPLELPWLNQPQVLGRTTTASGSANLEKLGIVYGFLPYWNINNYEINPAVTHLAYFRLAVNGKGEIVTESGDGGYQVFNSERMRLIDEQVKRTNLKYEVTFFTSISEDIDELIDCLECQDTLIASMSEVIDAHGLDGINIDFEYIGSVSAQKRQKFTDLMYKISNLLETRFPRTKLSIDVYGGAAKMNNIWDFPLLSKIVDRVIVMGYDYKTRRSSVPGPTAPILGKDVLGGDIWEDVGELMKYVPNQKIILAVPFYGYAWETTSDQLEEAQTYDGTGETLTYRGARNLLVDEELEVEEKWDERSLTPYLVWQTNNGTEEEPDPRWHIGFFENTRSLNYKLDMVDSLDLGGVAIWALGYEGQYDDLWDTIAKRF